MNFPASESSTHSASLSPGQEDQESQEKPGKPSNIRPSIFICLSSEQSKANHGHLARQKCRLLYTRSALYICTGYKFVYLYVHLCRMQTPICICMYFLSIEFASRQSAARTNCSLGNNLQQFPFCKFAINSFDTTQFILSA